MWLLRSTSAGNPGSIPGSGKSTGEGIGYPLQDSWALLVAQQVKNLPGMRETWIWSLGWGDPLEKGKATLSRILAWKIPWAVYSTGLQRVRHNWATFTFIFHEWKLFSDWSLPLSVPWKVQRELSLTPELLTAWSLRGFSHQPRWLRCRWLPELTPEAVLCAAGEGVPPIYDLFLCSPVPQALYLLISLLTLGSFPYLHCAFSAYS